MLNKIDEFFVRIERTICVITFLAMVAVVLWSVLCRRVLMIPFLAGEELTRYLAICSIFFGTSVAVKDKAHVGVEVFVNLLPCRALKAVKLLGEILTCLLFATLLVLSVKMLLQYGQTHQLTTITKLPMTLIYCCVPAGMFLSVLHGLTGIVYTFHAGKETDAA